jgi:hypothetical protein
MRLGRAPRQSAQGLLRQARSLPPREITSSNSLEIAARALLIAARSDSLSIPPEPACLKTLRHTSKITTNEHAREDADQVT